MCPRQMRWGPVLLCALAMAALLAPFALAGESSGTRTVTVADPLVVRIPFADGTYIDITYDVRVLTGTAVDVLLLDEAEYERYIAPESEEFAYYSEYSELDTREASDSFSLSGQGTYYIIVAPSESRPDDAAVVEFDVTWEEISLDSVICGVTVGVVLVVVVVAAVLLMRRPRRVEAQGRPSPQPPNRASAPPVAAAPAPATPPEGAAGVAQAPMERPIPVESIPEPPVGATTEEAPLPEPVYAAPPAYKVPRRGPPPGKGAGGPPGEA